MVDILHRVSVKASTPDDVIAALTTRDGLAAWWTNDTEGDAGPDGIVRFRFGERGGFDMKVRDVEPRRVLWEVVEGPVEWVGTHIRFDLTSEGDDTIVLFRHEGWREPVEFMHHCSTKWGVFLMSLKAQLETGKGAPWPNDVHIDNWG